MKRWFGYGLHLIADTQYELPVSFRITPASVSEQPVLGEMVKDLFDEAPEIATRCHDFSADRGDDQAGLKQTLWDKHAIRSRIDTRLLWREEKQAPDDDPSQPILRLLDPGRADNILHSERGEVHGCCPHSTGRGEPAALHPDAVGVTVVETG